MKNNCPVCKSCKILSFLERNNVPVNQNSLCKTREDAIDAVKGNLKLCICEECGFVFNKTFDIKKLKYGEHYDNTQDISSVFEDYLKEEIDFLIKNYDIKNKKIIEVGCGKGTFLKRLVEKSGCSGFGFDPSYVGEDVLFDGKLRFIREFYDHKHSNLEGDIIICRHLIEHIEYPLELLEILRDNIHKSENPLIFIETPSVKWIVKNNIIYDFFYEHCSYFDISSIKRALISSGFKVDKFLRKFGKQYMWVLATKGNNESSIYNDKKFIEMLKNKCLLYNTNCTKNIDKLMDRIKDLNTYGKVALWGAGAKGNTFVNLLDKENSLIDSVIDINKNKQGYFIEGTGHEIVDFFEIARRNIRTVIVMNSNYYGEINTLLKGHKIGVNLILGEDLL